MRPLLALVIVVAILGGLQLYMQNRTTNTSAPPVAIRHVAEGEFVVEITPTFDMGPDEFALDLSNAPSLTVALSGKEILRRTGSIPAGSTVSIGSVKGLLEGANEFFVAGTATDSAAQVSRGIRVKITRDGLPIGDSKTLWANPGEPVSGAVGVDIPRGMGGHNHGASDRGDGKNNVDADANTQTNSSEHAAASAVVAGLGHAGGLR